LIGYRDKDARTTTRLSLNRKLAAGFLCIVLAGFGAAAHAQTAPSGATMVQLASIQNPFPLPAKSLRASDYSLLDKTQPGHQAMFASANPGVQRKAADYHLLSWPQTGLLAQIDSDKVAGWNTMFSSPTLDLAQQRMPADEMKPSPKPLLAVHLADYELPIFLYVPNPQANW
jgi:hypothetical protein